MKLADRSGSLYASARDGGGQGGSHNDQEHGQHVHRHQGVCNTGMKGVQHRNQGVCNTGMKGVCDTGIKVSATQAWRCLQHWHGGVCNTGIEVSAPLASRCLQHRPGMKDVCNTGMKGVCNTGMEVSAIQA